ncbi:MAG: EAL domain-containing protein [Corallincola sp.]|nr:EAL domain-containing protein [Corallincola sp.]
MKIRTKLLLIILPVVLLVMLAAAFGGRQLVLDQAQNQLFSRAEAMAIAHANQHELQVRQTLAHLRLLSRISEMQLYLSSDDALQQRLTLLPKLRQVLMDVLGQMPRYSEIALLDSQGRERVQVAQQIDPFNRFEERYPELLMRLQQKVGRELALYASDRRAPKPRLWVGWRFVASSGEQSDQQQLLAALDLDDFEIALNDLLARDQLALLVADRHNQLVTAPARLASGLNSELLRLLALDPSYFAQQARTIDNGGERYLVREAMVDSNLRILAIVSHSRVAEVAGPVLSTTAGVMASALIVLGLMLVVLFGRLVLRPLTRLQQQIDATAAGEVRELPAIGGDDEVSRLYFAYARMINQLRSVQGNLRQAIVTDALTGLLSRRGLEEVLRQQQRHGQQQRYALLHIGLDDFKLVNDMHGHGMGDRALAEFARLLRQEAEAHAGHPQLCQLARISGDEFAVLLHGHEQDSGDGLARRLQVRLHTPLRLDDLNLFLKCSIGIAACEREQLTDLNRRAALALEDAKLSGKQVRRLYSDELEEQVRTTQLIEDALKQAISNNELTLMFQPYLRAADSQLAGAEALLRWHSPTLGQVGPDRFIPVAEKSGLIIALDRWVVRSAITALAAIRLSGANQFRLAVNVSTRQLQEPDFADYLDSCLREFGVPSSAIELELTETAITQVDATFVQLAVRLHELGVALVLDDFGTGFTSLNHLSQLPIRKLKIDRQHVNQIGQQRHGVALVDVVVSLSQAFGFAITAEGVESEAQWRYLRDLKVDYLQGYRFYRPMPLADLQQLLAQGATGAAPTSPQANSSR